MTSVDSSAPAGQGGPWARAGRIAARWEPLLFWSVVALATLVRLLLTGDIGPHLVYGPHDASLYVSRAYELLQGRGFGPYDSRLLIKLPGISLWIALMRMLGVPYMFSVNALYAAAGMYLLAILRRMRFSNWCLLPVYVIYLFNPETFSYFFQNPFREPVGIGLLIIQLAAMIGILEGLRSRSPWGGHLLLLATAMGFDLILREEGVLLYAFLGIFAIAAFYQLQADGQWRSRHGKQALAAILVVPLLSIAGWNLAARGFIRAHYGAFLINDFGGGEYPPFIAALRSVKSDGKSRFVGITQEAMQRIAAAVPALAPVVAHLPVPPPPDNPMLSRYGIKGEWPNALFMFWIKDTAYAVGLTPTLVASEDFFRRERLEIEQACAAGRLQCERDGGGLFPAFRLSWIPVMIREYLRGGTMMLRDLGGPPRGPAASTLGEGYLSPGNLVSLGDQYEVSTFAPFDSLTQWNTANAGSGKLSVADEFKVLHWDRGAEIKLNLEYWLRYPDVAAHPGLGLRQHLTPQITQAVSRAVAPWRMSPEVKAEQVPPDQAKVLERLGLFNPQEAFNGWRGYPLDLYLDIKYLLGHPRVAEHLAEGGPNVGADHYGAFRHYEMFGRREGRVWSTEPLWKLVDGSQGSPADLAIRPYVSPLASWRAGIPGFAKVNALLMLLGFLALVVRLVRRRWESLDALRLVVLSFLVFSAVKLLAFSYLSVPMGSLDARLYFESYVALALLASLLALEDIKPLAKRWLRLRTTPKGGGGGLP